MKRLLAIAAGIAIAYTLVAGVFTLIALWVNREHTIQTQCVRWFAIQYPTLNQLLFAIPNGGHRNKAAAGKAKAEGATRGVADLFLSIPHERTTRLGLVTTCGLYIEMETPKGRQSPEQTAFQIKVEALGYQYTICRSLEEFQITVTEYLSLPPTRPLA